MQKDANLAELEKCCRTHIFLQNFVLIQSRTSPPKICIFANFANYKAFSHASGPLAWPEVLLAAEADINLMEKKMHTPPLNTALAAGSARVMTLASYRERNDPKSRLAIPNF